jgi:hypothetical protein
MYKFLVLVYIGTLLSNVQDLLYSYVQEQVKFKTSPYSCSSLHCVYLKGPKLEIFGFRVFSLIRPVWVGDLGTRPKNSKFC